MRSTPTSTLKNLWPGQGRLALVAVSLLLTGAVGCSPQTLVSPTAPAVPPPTEQVAEPTAAPPTLTPEPTVPAGWQTQASTEFQYALSYPPNIEVNENGQNSWTLGVKLANPSGVLPNFLYLSVIPAGFQSAGGEIYNYNTPEAELLLNVPVGESKPLHPDLNVEGFTYTRLPDTLLNGLTAKTYENTQPWEFPAGTKEMRYYVQTETYTYLLGGYITTTDANQPGAITKALLDEIVATFRVLP